MKKILFHSAALLCLICLIGVSACKKNRNTDRVDKEVVTQDGPFTISSIGAVATITAYHEDRSPNINLVTIPAYITHISGGVFRGARMQQVLVQEPSKLVEIGADAFASTPNLSRVALPLSLQKIGDRAFKDAKNLSMILMNEQTPPSLGANAFENAGAEEKINSKNLKDDEAAGRNTEFITALREARKDINSEHQLSHWIMLVPRGKTETYMEAYKNTNLGSGFAIYISLDGFADPRFR